MLWPISHNREYSPTPDTYHMLAFASIASARLLVREDGRAQGCLHGSGFPVAETHPERSLGQHSGRWLHHPPTRGLHTWTDPVRPAAPGRRGTGEPGRHFQGMKEREIPGIRVQMCWECVRGVNLCHVVQWDINTLGVILLVTVETVYFLFGGSVYHLREIVFSHTPLKNAFNL